MFCLEINDDFVLHIRSNLTVIFDLKMHGRNWKEIVKKTQTILLNEYDLHYTNTLVFSYCIVD